MTRNIFTKVIRTMGEFLIAQHPYTNRFLKNTI